MEMQRNQNNQNNFKKEEKNRKLIVPDFMTLKTETSINGTKQSPDTGTYIYEHLIFIKAIQQKKDIFSNTGTGTINWMPMSTKITPEP